jgi:hypothetical protein
MLQTTPQATAMVLPPLASTSIIGLPGRTHLNTFFSKPGPGTSKNAGRLTRYSIPYRSTTQHYAPSGSAYQVPSVLEKSRAAGHTRVCIIGFRTTRTTVACPAHFSSYLLKVRNPLEQKIHTSTGPDGVLHTKHLPFHYENPDTDSRPCGPLAWWSPPPP